jgi:hypothetical protein
MEGHHMKKCQCCKRAKAIYRVGNDGFGARTGALVCDNYACRTWASYGYPVTFHAIKKEA